ncbi:hypothetical protein SDC9_155100 [bioreactor metagenome]|uniref:Uncharacterized protein n=1 Tax=bioreactor metagenome TaxID=1076179 RepID=A0A645F0I3_9ZZZZ
MVHRRDLAVHQRFGMHDAPTEGFANRLVAEADAEQRNLAGEFLDRRQRHAGLRRRAGAGRNDQIVGLEAGDLGQRDGVVAEDFHLLAKFAEIMDEVVGEAVVVVDHQ